MRRCVVRFVAVSVGLIAVALVSVPSAAGQERLAQAKALYASASYEEALQALGTLPARNAAVESTELAAYQVFCLLALGRSAEAKQAIEAIVHTDPLFHPAEGQVAPRIRAFFDDTRRPLLPEIVRSSYAQGKDAFTRKEAARAVVEFDRVIALVNEIGEGADAAVADLRTLAAGFRDLAAAMVPAPAPVVTRAAREPAPPAPPSAPPPPVTASAPPAAAGTAAASPPVYTAENEDVSKPIAVSRSLPQWTPKNPFDAQREFRGVVEITTNEMGLVTSATLTKSVHPLYDQELLRAVAGWRFKPAVKNGAPVRYTSRIEVALGAK